MALRATDAASGWIGEMRGIQNRIVLRALRKQALSRGACFSGTLVGEERNVRPHELDRVVDNVPHEHRPCSTALGVHDHATRGMAGRILEPDAILDLAV